MARDFISIRDLEQLEQLFPDFVVEGRERESLAKVLQRFPVRLTPHIVALARSSKAVARQFLPDPRELDSAGGEERCFTGLLETGIACVERAYLDRCIIMPQPTCPAYCRFCFRKFYEHGEGRAASAAELEAAVGYVASQPDLREVLITGGEPILDRRLPKLLSELRALEHIGPIRIACRSLVTAPWLVDAAFIALLRAHQDLRAGRPIEVALHCNHPAELTAPTIEALCQLREAGIHVYNQAVLLREINLDAPTLTQLFRQLRGHGVESYHLFFGGPVRGMNHLRPTLDEALALKSALRESATGRLNPHLIVTTRIGKVELGVDGWIVERESASAVWLRTPYRLETFRRIVPSFALPADCRVDETGRLVVRYMDGHDGTADRE